VRIADSCCEPSSQKWDITAVNQLWDMAQHSVGPNGNDEFGLTRRWRHALDQLCALGVVEQGTGDNIGC
jgi:hypothetical protein